MKWLFRAYESESHYNKGVYFFEKVFDDHDDLKEFSAKHSRENKVIVPNYCSMYWRIEREDGEV